MFLTGTQAPTAVKMQVKKKERSKSAKIERSELPRSREKPRNSTSARSKPAKPIKMGNSIDSGTTSSVANTADNFDASSCDGGKNCTNCISICPSGSSSPCTDQTSQMSSPDPLDDDTPRQQTTPRDCGGNFDREMFPSFEGLDSGSLRGDSVDELDCDNMVSVKSEMIRDKCYNWSGQEEGEQSAMSAIVEPSGNANIVESDIVITEYKTPSPRSEQSDSHSSPKRDLSDDPLDDIDQDDSEQEEPRSLAHQRMQALPPNLGILDDWGVESAPNSTREEHVNDARHVRFELSGSLSERIFENEKDGSSDERNKKEEFQSKLDIQDLIDEPEVNILKPDEDNISQSKDNRNEVEKEIDNPKPKEYLSQNYDEPSPKLDYSKTIVPDLNLPVQLGGGLSDEHNQDNDENDSSSGGSKDNQSNRSSDGGLIDHGVAGLKGDDYSSSVKKMIANIEIEETKSSYDSGIEQCGMKEEELESLKSKCISRWKKNQDTPIPLPPPLVKDFSNTQKLLDILDKSSAKDDETLHKVKCISHKVNPNMPRMGDLLCKTTAELAEQILNLSIELETERRTVTVLKTGIETNKNTVEENIRELNRENSHRLEVQKRQYAEALNRHQTFIDQLIDDKKAISIKCESLTKELRALERRSRENLAAQEARHTMEVNRLKQLSESADKIKRERWMDQKAKKIKEQTVKSLENEVEKIMRKHSNEVGELKAEAQRKLEEQEHFLRNQFNKTFDQFRVQTEREKREDIEQEKLFQIEKFRKQAEQIEAYHLGEVQQLREEIERERRKLELERGRWSDEAEHIRKQAKDKADLVIEGMREDMDEMKKALQRRHANELITIKANEESERKEYERKLNDQFDQRWKEKEEKLIKIFSKEKAAEIEKLTSKFEFEMKKSREETEKTFDSRLDRYKQKHDTDISEMMKEIEDYKCKLTKVREQMLKTEEDNAILSSLNKKLEIKADELEESKAKLVEERKDIAGVIRKEFTKSLEKLGDENRKLAEEINNMVVKHKGELFQKDQQYNKLQHDFELEMDQLQGRVEETLAKKDKMLEDINEQYDVAVRRIDQLENVIGNQGKSLFQQTKSSKQKSK